MKWIYDADGNADLEEVAFAEKGISAILENVDLSLRRQVMLRMRLPCAVGSSSPCGPGAA